ncbi:PREDICTED: mpv17-like protein 2 isoform X2 [Amphimedon queenslandica]|uniref:Mpv17-like protein 2 n=1 Tax=Amphimedon queenslandica TaxID=400682 RepID=A0AAN0JSC4_AMPQE|nr:PREDICTED: mpv17-like protein 2 isoform X2 [Amphimedon queenslandica]|eukprot:XP_019859767.1 PREDICTED: mpv17-like protein 2 isoform X2 [Amphimedon queenslandica]
MAWRLVYDTLFSRYLLFTNTVVSCGLEALGDLLVQKYEKNSEQEIDWARTKRMAVIGFILGPPEHYWFKFLDKRYPGRGVVSVFKKVTLDEVINGPACVIVFFLGFKLLLCASSFKSDVHQCSVSRMGHVFILLPTQEILKLINSLTNFIIIYVQIIYCTFTIL